MRYEEQYSATSSDTSRPSMIKVEDMDAMWTYMWNTGAQEFFTLALFGEDAFEKGISPSSRPSDAKM